MMGAVYDLLGFSHDGSILSLVFYVSIGVQLFCWLRSWLDFFGFQVLVLTPRPAKTVSGVLE